jgi:hypothetical protein
MTLPAAETLHRGESCPIAQSLPQRNPIQLRSLPFLPSKTSMGEVLKSTTAPGGPPLNEHMRFPNPNCLEARPEVMRHHRPRRGWRKTLRPSPDLSIPDFISLNYRRNCSFRWKI